MEYNKLKNISGDKGERNMNVIRDFGNNIIGGADGPTSVFVAWKPSTEMLIAVAVLGLLFCFFGLKMAKVLITINGAFIGLAVGIGIAGAFHAERTIFLVIMLACALVTALLALVLYKFGVFCMVFSGTLGFALSLLAAMGLISSGNISSALSGGTKEMIIGIAALVTALVLAALSVKFAEPMLIIVTSLAGGMAAGPRLLSLAGLGDKILIGYGAGALLAILGMVLQFMMNSRKSGKKEKRYAAVVKKKDSVESEVEKARTILEDDDDEE